MCKHIYNLKVKKEDPCKLKFLKLNQKLNLPSKVDHRTKFQAVYDQGNLGSCTACALCGLVGYKHKGFYGSRLFLYYLERKMDNNVPYDSGATLADGISCLKKYGVCDEKYWPYIIGKFRMRPNANCFKIALKNQSLRVLNITNNLTTMKNALANGHPFVFGIMVYDSFESDSATQTGVIPVPNIDTESLLGGHALVCVGYDDSKSVFIVRNSWGTSWGDKGYCYIPYDYLTNDNLTSDLWCILKQEK
jgi:C1A family cysteine protease